jgi:hypothetical protein
MRRAVLALLLVSAPASADTCGGFSGFSPPYLVNQDRVCAPLEVTGGNATGAPQCQAAKPDEIAQLSIKPPTAQHGTNADFTATASGRTLTVTSSTGAAVVTWTAADPIGKIIDTFASATGDRVAVTFTSRAFGHESTQVVAFLLVKTSGRDPNATNTTKPQVATPTGQPTPDDPKLAKAVADARKQSGAKALSAWQHVLALDADHSEARYRVAAAHAAAKQADALALLQTLAKSSRTDAIEWLVEARFDPAFAALRADASYRAAVGLDRPATGTYEKLMGLGGQWLQNGTQCDTGEVHFTAKQDRSFSIKFRSACGGGVVEQSFKGTWELSGDGLKLTLPTKGKSAAADDVAVCTFEKAGQEDALRCALAKDLDFVVLPVRR